MNNEHMGNLRSALASDDWTMLQDSLKLAHDIPTLQYVLQTAKAHQLPFILNVLSCVTQDDGVEQLTDIAVAIVEDPTNDVAMVTMAHRYVDDTCAIYEGYEPLLGLYFFNDEAIADHLEDLSGDIPGPYQVDPRHSFIEAPHCLVGHDGHLYNLDLPGATFLNVMWTSILPHNEYIVTGRLTSDGQCRTVTSDMSGY